MKKTKAKKVINSQNLEIEELVDIIHDKTGLEKDEIKKVIDEFVTYYLKKFKL